MVDDDQMNLIILKAKLQQASRLAMRGPPLDWVADTAETGEAALHMNAQHSYSVICMDEHLDEKGKWLDRCLSFVGSTAR